MADPVTLLVAGSTVLGAAGQISAGKAAEQEGRANQQIAERNAIKAEQDAQTAIDLGKRNVAIFERDFNAYQSKTTSAYLKSGVRLDGTPLEVLTNMHVFLFVLLNPHKRQQLTQQYPPKMLQLSYFL